MIKEEAIKHLQTDEHIFAAFSRFTQLPYVTCDEESFNDQVWIFSTEEEVKAFGKKCLEDKTLLVGVQVVKKQYPRFYGTLHAIGVNSVVYTREGETLEIELTDIARQADLSKIPENQRPLLNPTLQLSGIYFMQELRRPVKPEERRNIRELEEELLANMKKSFYLMALDSIEDEQGQKKVQVPYLKNKDGKIFQPIFTDAMELDKFIKGKKMRILKVPFQDLKKLMIPNAEGYVINPLGFNLALSKVQVDKIKG
ncbi:MAG: SseB family protein [Eubacteriales bacterium]|nr:SseB family protein [Eubacteriales bacterium]